MLTIRPCVSSDLPALIDLYQHLIEGDARPDLGRADAILDQLNRISGSSILVGSLANRLVTSCTLIVIPNLTRGGAPYALIENVVTDSTLRGRGFGRQVLDAAVAAAWAAGCYKVMLMTGSKQPATLKFYGDAGFEQTKTGFQIRRIAARAD